MGGWEAYRGHVIADAHIHEMSVQGFYGFASSTHLLSLFDSVGGWVGRSLSLTVGISLPMLISMK